MTAPISFMAGESLHGASSATLAPCHPQGGSDSPAATAGADLPATPGVGAMVETTGEGCSPSRAALSASTFDTSRPYFNGCTEDGPRVLTRPPVDAPSMSEFIAQLCKEVA